MSRILLADSNDFAQRMGTRFLEAEGHDVTAVSESNEVLRLIRANRPDVAILDTQMPGNSGLDLCRQIKSDPELRRMKVVLLGRVLDPMPAAEARNAGSDALLHKPLDASQLVMTVNTLIEEMTAAMPREPGDDLAVADIPVADTDFDVPADPDVQGVSADGSDSENQPEPESEIESAGALFEIGEEASNATVGLEAETGNEKEEKEFVEDRAPELNPALSAARVAQNGSASIFALGHAVSISNSREVSTNMTDTEELVEQREEFLAPVDFAQIVDEALGNDSEERELQKRIERAIHVILQPAIAEVAAKVTGEVYTAYRAQRRVEEAVNGLLLPAVMSIVDGSSRGVMAAFNSK